MECSATRASYSSCSTPKSDSAYGAVGLSGPVFSGHHRSIWPHPALSQSASRERVTCGLEPRSAWPQLGSDRHEARSVPAGRR